MENEENREEGFSCLEISEKKDSCVVTGFCSSLKDHPLEVKIPETYHGKPVTEIGEEAFKGEKLTSLSLPDSLKIIGESAFEGCKNLREVSLPSGLESLGRRAFQDCTSLKEVSFPSHPLKEIDVFPFSEGAPGINWLVFSGCTALSSIRIEGDSSIYKVEGNCLLSKDGKRLIFGLKNTEIPSSVEVIGKLAFYGLDFPSLLLPDSLKKIEARAFEGCSKLKEIPLPKSLEEIGACAFAGDEELTEMVLPSSLKVLGGGAFFHCRKLTSISLPDSLSEIEEHTFDACVSLRSVFLGKNLKVIHDWAFLQDSNISFLVLPPKLEEIEEFAFAECSLGLVIPASLTDLPNLDFLEDGGVKALYFEKEEKGWKLSKKQKEEFEEKIFFYSEKGNADGKHWHYVDGKPKAWSLAK